MAGFSLITMAGGVKAPAFTQATWPDFSRTLPSAEVTPIAPACVAPRASDYAVAFAAMSDLVAEAARAEARLMMSASWDIACSAIAAEDMDAFDAALFASGMLLHMPLSRGSDWPLARTARFIHRSLLLESPKDWAKARRRLAAPQTFNDLVGAQSIGQMGAAMIRRALQRLDALFTVLDAGASSSVDLTTGCGAEAPGDADQEVQAF